MRAGTVTRTVYRSAVGALGLAVVIGGLLLVPLPGPGWLIVFVGLGILSSEFEWAARLLRWGRAKLSAWTSWIAARGLPVQALFGLLGLAVVAGVMIGYLAWQGVPTWLPDPVEDRLNRWVPGAAAAT